MPQHFGEVASGRTLEQAVSKLAGRGVTVNFQTYTDGKREWVAEAGCAFSPLNGKPALSQKPYRKPTDFGRAVASAATAEPEPITLLGNHCPSCNMVAVAQSMKLLAHCATCGVKLSEGADSDADLFLTETSMDYNALLEQTPAEAGAANGGLPPAGSIKNTGLLALPSLDELDLTATASEDDPFADLTSLSEDAIVQDFTDSALACGDGEGCDPDDDGDAEGDDDGDGAFDVGQDDTGLGELPEVVGGDYSYEADAAATLEALANPENYEELDVLEGMACASAGVPSDLQLVFASGSGAGDARWFVMASKQPIAVAEESGVPQGMRSTFATGNFHSMVMSAIASVGLVPGLRACGFKGVTVSVPVKQAINSAVASATAAVEAKFEDARASHAELFSQSISMAAVALNKNFYSDRPNPLRAALIDGCTRNGMALATAQNVVDTAMALAGSDYSAELLDLTEQFMGSSVETRAALASAIGAANYIKPAATELPAAVKRTSAVASSHVVSGGVPAFQPVPVSAAHPEVAVAAPSYGVGELSLNALLNSVMPLGR